MDPYKRKIETIHYSMDGMVGEWGVESYLLNFKEILVCSGYILFLGKLRARLDFVASFCFIFQKCGI